MAEEMYTPDSIDIKTTPEELYLPEFIETTTDKILYLILQQMEKLNAKE